MGWVKRIRGRTRVRWVLRTVRRQAERDWGDGGEDFGWRR